VVDNSNIGGIRRVIASQYPLDVGLRCVSVQIPDDDSYLWLLAGFVSLLGNSWSWLGTPAQRDDYSQLWKKAYAATDWDGCMNCDDLIACLQPLFDDLTAQISALQIQVDSVSDQTTYLQNAQNANKTGDRPVNQSSISGEICSGAFAIVNAMNQENLANYADTEDSTIDNVFEFIPKVLKAIPIFGELPFDEMFEFVNWLFEHQVDEYNADYPDIEDQLTCDLACLITANDNEFTWDVWADWLDLVGEGTTTPGSPYENNRAAGLFAKYSPTRQTWINQIAAAVNKENSLQTYFDTLSVAWTGGLQDTRDCTGCDCSMGWSHTFNATNGWGDWGAELDSALQPIGVLVSGVWEGRSCLIGATTAFGVWIKNTIALAHDFVVSVRYDYAAGDGSYGQNTVTSAGFAGFPSIVQGTDVENTSGTLTASAAGIGIQFLSQFGGSATGSVTIIEITVSSDTGFDPYL